MDAFVHELKCYNQTQIMCQKYLGPPSWYKGTEPEHLTEIFLSNMGRNITEFEVYALCRTFGHIYQIRLPVTFADSKGFAYCRFFDKQSAAVAIDKLNESNFRDRKIKVSLSMDTRVIQIMGLPDWPHLSIRKYLEGEVPNATDIKINHKFKFALITFGSHNAAQVSIRELKKNAIFSRVQWARGDNDLPEEYFQAVQDLYVGHLPPGCSLNQLRSALCHIINPEIVIRIHRSGCYGFIYFNSHTEAEAALLCLRASNIIIGGQAITFNWLKGEYSKKRSETGISKTSGTGTLWKFENGSPNSSQPTVEVEPNMNEEINLNFNLWDMPFDRAPGAERAARRNTDTSQDSGIGYSQPYYFPTKFVE